ncbi:MAG: SDR family NAD(P)-dependent oxidoreductase, partial [Pseudoalteromonas shioyasakiensis]
MTNVAIVTGGSKGIGKAIVERLEREDYTVYNLDITPSEGNYRHCDVSDVQQVKSVIAEIIAETGRVDALISNAGRHLSASIENTDEATFDALFALNVKGAYAAIQAVLPSMKSQQGGSIVLVASDQAIIGKPNSFAYNLTKHALASMAKTTALDYA